MIDRHNQRRELSADKEEQRNSKHHNLPAIAKRVQTIAQNARSKGASVQSQATLDLVPGTDDTALLSKRQDTGEGYDDDEIQLMQPLPWWDSDKRATPNILARSALFTIRPNKQQRWVASPSKPRPIPCAGDVQIYLVGEELRQDDADVLYQILHYARLRAKSGGWVYFKASELLHDLGWDSGGKMYTRLKNIITRLASALVVLEGADSLRTHFRGKGFTLLNGLDWGAKQGPHSPTHWRVRVSRNVINLFWVKYYSRFEWEVRKQLSSLTAKHLHLIYSSYADVPILSVEELRLLSGSTTARLARFKEMLEDANNELVSVGFLESWRYLDSSRKAIQVIRKGSRLCRG